MILLNILKSAYLFILMQLIGIIVSIRKQINLDAQKKLNKKIKKQFMSCESINQLILQTHLF